MREVCILTESSYSRGCPAMSASGMAKGKRIG